MRALRRWLQNICSRSDNNKSPGQAENIMLVTKQKV